MSRKKQRWSQALLPAYYTVEITSWDWNYSFSVNVQRYEDRRFMDYRHLHIRGKLLRPRRINVEAVELIFFPNIEPSGMEQRHDQPPPRGVGSLNIQGKKSEGMNLAGYLSMPTDAIGPVLQMLLGGRFKYVVLDGEHMRYRKALIRHYEIKTEHNEEDYPDDE
jgi:hypothetical protein